MVRPVEQTQRDARDLGESWLRTSLGSSAPYNNSRRCGGGYKVGSSRSLDHITHVATGESESLAPGPEVSRAAVFPDRGLNRGSFPDI